MPALDVGNRAFKTVLEALGILTQESLDQIEVGPVIPTLDMSRHVESSVVDWWTLSHEESLAGAGVQSAVFDVRPQTAGDWDLITRWNIPSSTAIPEEEDVLVVEAGVAISSATLANFTAASIFRQGPTGGTLSATARTIMWYADALAGSSNMVYHDGGPTVITPYPWFSRQTDPDTVDSTLRARLDVSGALDAIFTLKCISARPGVLQRYLR